MTTNILFYGGIGVCVLAVAGAAFAAVIFHMAKAKLKKQLEASYGKQRR